MGVWKQREEEELNGCDGQQCSIMADKRHVLFGQCHPCRPLLTAYRPGSILTNFSFRIIISNVINVVTMSGVGNKSNNRKR